MDNIQQGLENLKQGGKTEAAILFALAESEFEVLIPWNHYSRFDFVIHKDNKFFKIQCKSGTLKNGVISFRPFSTIKKNGKSIRTYYKDDVDFFFVYCKENGRVYFIKTTDVSKQICHFYLEPKSKLAKKAENFEFKGIL